MYGEIVAQARQSEFYRELGVPDTLDGRFDMIVLHVVLVARRLRREGEAGRDLSQSVIETFFADMDRSLREMGVGDLVVPKRVRRMAEAFYGRASAYERALATEGTDAIGQALTRNVLGGGEPGGAVDVLVRYVRETDAALAAQSGADVLSGRLSWAEIGDAALARV